MLPVSYLGIWILTNAFDFKQTYLNLVNKTVVMCRNIKTLFNFDPPATDEEILTASAQFVRKLSGFQKPSKANEVVMDRATVKVAKIARELIDSLITEAAPKNREEEAQKARARAAKRFGRVKNREL